MEKRSMCATMTPVHLGVLASCVLQPCPLDYLFQRPRPVSSFHSPAYISCNTMVGIFSTMGVLEKSSPGLLAALPRADLGLLVSGFLVFGWGKLVPSYDHSWYKNLQKPDWTPPNYVFPMVWIPLKLAQSVALWLAVKSAPNAKSLVLPLAAFGIHLVLGNWWNVVFFGRHQMRASVRWMGAFWASIAATIATFSSVSPLAAWLVAPTQVWVSVAWKLNADIVALNSKE